MFRLRSARFAFARSIALASPEAGLLTRRSSLHRLAFPFRRTVAYCAGRSLLTVAGPCGICTRFPFHSPRTASTSGSFKASTRIRVGQSAWIRLDTASSTSGVGSAVVPASRSPDRLVFDSVEAGPPPGWRPPIGGSHLRRLLQRERNGKTANRG